MPARILLLVPLALLFLAGYLAGGLDLLQDPERVRILLTESGIWGPVTYVVGFSLLEPFGIPGVLFVLPATLVWPKGTAFLLSWLGAIGAGCVGFGLARAMGRGWIENHLPDRYRRYDEDLAKRGLRTVILVRLAFFLASPAHWILGLSKVSFPTFLLGSMIGFIPGIAALVFLGKGAMEWLMLQPPGVWIAIASMVACGALAYLRRVYRIKASRHAETRALPDPAD